MLCRRCLLQLWQPINAGDGVAVYQNQWQKQCMTTDIDAPIGDQEVSHELP